MNIVGSLVTAAPAAVVPTPTSAHARPPDDLQSTRAATARFHSIGQATAFGYGELRDASGIACIDNPAGGMGIHYVNGALVGDPALTATSPEVLVYHPLPDGRLKLVALEYVILESTWRADHPDPAESGSPTRPRWRPGLRDEASLLRSTVHGPGSVSRPVQRLGHRLHR